MIEITVDPRQMIGALDALGERQLPFATMKALNECATSFQTDERKGIQGSFTIRRPWVLQGVKIDRQDFARKDKLSVRVHIDQDRDFLNKFEDGGTRRPVGTSRSLAVPISVRRTKAQVISKTQTPKSFHFSKAFTSRKSRWTIIQGERGAFILQRPDGSGLILQRTGKQQMGPHRYRNRNSVVGRGYGHDPYLKVLWSLRPSTPVPRTLHFTDTAKSSFLSNWPGTFKKWYLEALRTANP